MQTRQEFDDESLDESFTEEKEVADVSDSDEEILRLAKERFKLSIEAEKDLRDLAAEDLRFSVGDQWDPAQLKARQEDRRPSLTINRIPQFVRQVANDIRQNRPAIKVSPVDSNADVETARILQGLIRHIEYSSNADTAYDTASDSAARVGFGFFRVVTEFADHTSFNQEIKIKRVADRFSCRLDPSFTEPDGSDANWGFVEEKMSIDDFKTQFPKSKFAIASDSTEFADEMNDGWLDESSVRVTEYFYKTFEEKTLCLLDDGSTCFEGDEIPFERNVIDHRKTLVPSVKWAKLCGCEVLERTDWAGRWIPIIPVLGEEMIIDGKKVWSGVVRNAKDSQRMYNYFVSCETEQVALAPRAPWIAPEGSFEGHESKWRTANQRNHAFLEYKLKPLAGGGPAPAPQRVQYEPAIQAISNARMLAAEDMKATTGIYDAAMGNKSNENSGVAIQRRANQSQTSNFHFADNLSKSIRHLGRILIDLIPSIYDTEQSKRILGEDGSEEIVQLNTVVDGEPQAMLAQGKYDVSVSSGPSYETKRQEAVQTQIELMKAIPEQAQFLADYFVGNMDIPQAKEIAERLKKMLPAQLQEDKSKDPLPPQAVAQMQQMSQMIEQLTQQLQAAQSDMQTKKLELDSRERIESMKLETQATIKLAELQSKEALGLLQHQIAELDQRQKMTAPMQEQAAPQEQGLGLEQNYEQDFSTGGDMQPGQSPNGVFP